MTGKSNSQPPGRNTRKSSQEISNQRNPQKRNLQINSNSQVTPSKKPTKKGEGPSTSKTISKIKNSNAPGCSTSKISLSSTISMADSTQHIYEKFSYGNHGNLRKMKVKPIIVDCSYVTVRRFLNELKLEPKPLMKLIRNDDHPQIKIDCASIDIKSAVMEKFIQNNCHFHTHSEPGSRVKLFVLKKFIHGSCDDIKTILIENNVPVSKVSFLLDSVSHPIYLIHSNDEDLNIQILKHQHSAIDQLIVKWEKYDFRRRRPMPCRNCKMWGHAAINCKRPYRCIKCDQSHEPGKCARKDRNIGHPTCVYCGGEHPANSQTCPSFKKYQERILQRKQHTRNHKQSTKNAPPITPNLSPHGRIQNLNFRPRNQNTYAGIVSKSLNESDCDLNLDSNNNLNFFDLNNQFNAIPNIGKTLKKFSELILKLNTSDESQHLSILLGYCNPQFSQISQYGFY